MIVAKRAIRSVVLAAVCAAAFVTGTPAMQPAAAQDYGQMTINPAEVSTMRQVPLGLGKSLVIDLPRDAKDVLVSNPAIADAVMRTARRAYLIGVEVGHTNVFFFDAAGRQIAVLDVTVERDAAALTRAIRQVIPGAQVRAEAMNGNIVLTGSVPTPADAVNAGDIAARFAGGAENVLNMIAAQGSEQVHLKVTVAEVKRNMLKQFGIDISAVIADGTRLAVLTNTPFGLGSAISNTSGRATFGGGADSLTTTVRAMEQNGLLRVLAEPTLSAISGEAAEFLAGGEFPVPTGYDRTTDTVRVEYKKFGVSLAFTPVVHTGGRITMRVRSEVSELTSETTVQVGPLTIPGINTRQTETTIELPSGGSLVLAGLLKQDTRQVLNGIPGLKDIPVLGALFRSRDYANSETELVVIATPYLVKPVAPSELVRPDRNLAPASDPETVLLGRINRIYGTGSGQPTGGYRGSVGFIID